MLPGFPTPLLAKVPRTLSEFTAHIATLTANTKTDDTGFGTFNGLVRCSSFVKTGSMWGTPWGAEFTNDSNAGRAFQQGLPSEAVFDGQITNSGTLVADIYYAGTISSFPATTRNNYTSTSYGSFTGTRILSLIYWDYSLSAAFRIYPYTTVAAAAYDF